MSLNPSGTVASGVSARENFTPEVKFSSGRVAPHDKSIAIVTPVFPPYRGGIGKVAQEDAAQLAALGFDVTVYVPVPRGGKAVPIADGAPYRVVQTKPFVRYGLGALMPGYASLLKTHDAVLLHYPFYGGAEPLWLGKMLGFGRSRRSKLITTYHMDVVGAGWLGAYMGWHSRIWMPRIIWRSDKVLVTSFDYARNGLLAEPFGSAPQKFGELPPSVDVQRFSPGLKSAELLARYGLRADEKVVVQVGGLDQAHYFKGVPYLLEALSDARLAGVRAVIVGEGDLRATLEARARELGVAERVTFAGSVPEAELPDHYRLADVFAFPSIDKTEAFGIAALEAAACGVPIVASALAGVRTVARDGINGLLVPPSKPESLAAAIADLLTGDVRREVMGSAGRKIAVEEYSDEARLARWKTLLTELGLLAAS